MNRAVLAIAAYWLSSHAQPPHRRPWAKGSCPSISTSRWKASPIRRSPPTADKSHRRVVGSIRSMSITRVRETSTLHRWTAIPRSPNGAHMLDVNDIDENGLAVGVLPDPDQPGDMVRFATRRPGQIRQLTFLNDNVLQGTTLGEVEEICTPRPTTSESKAGSSYRLI